VTYGSVSAARRTSPRSRRSSLHPLSPQNWEFDVFQLLACNLACLAIASLYYAWRDVYMHRRKRAQLHDRVAYMLWVAAQRAA
jgi:hypothetical protein